LNAPKAQRKRKKKNIKARVHQSPQEARLLGMH
jgi:hypothetical protein